jgi:hypothetical protein
VLPPELSPDRSKDFWLNEARRERIRELVRMLESAQEQVHAIWIEEDKAFEDRSPPSKETESGNISETAAHFLSEAEGDIQNAIDQMQLAIGDASFPEPTSVPIKRRF